MADNNSNHCTLLYFTVLYCTNISSVLSIVANSSTVPLCLLQQTFLCWHPTASATPRFPADQKKLFRRHLVLFFPVSPRCFSGNPIHSHDGSRKILGSCSGSRSFARRTESQMVHPNTNRTGPRLEWPTLFVFGVHKQTHFVLLTSSVLGMSRCCLGNRACVGLCSVDPVPLLFHHHHRGRRQCWHQQTTQTPVTETTLILIRFCILHLDFFLSTHRQLK